MHLDLISEAEKKHPYSTSLGFQPSTPSCQHSESFNDKGKWVKQMAGKKVWGLGGQWQDQTNICTNLKENFERPKPEIVLFVKRKLRIS